MIDTAQLREALARIVDNFQMSSEVGIPIVRESEWEVAFKAAEKYLTLKEAGALIITPDEDGKWPIEVIAGMAGVFYAVREQGGTLTDIFIGQLDALRDAMPDRGSE